MDRSRDILCQKYVNFPQKNNLDIGMWETGAKWLMVNPALDKQLQKRNMVICVCIYIS